MEIDKNLAQTIVTDMKVIIKQDINFINTEGIIIASTDEERIGKFHEGGIEAIKIKDNLIISNDSEFRGARKGINMPIYFREEIAGIIGVTGETKEVRKYGEIIKRMTELLIRDAYLFNLKVREKENQRLIIEEIIGNNNLDDKSFLNKTKFFNVEQEVERMVLLAHIENHDLNNYEVIEEIVSIFKKEWEQIFKPLIMNNNNKIIMIIENDNKYFLEKELEEIIDTIFNKYNVLINVGIGSLEEDINRLKFSYEKALIALDWVRLSSKEYIKSYEKMNLELLLDDVDDEIIDIYKKKLVGSMSEKEYEELMRITSLFEIYNGSITNISDEMFIHKNTLQYKLSKIYKKTGYDLRNYGDFTLFKLLLMLENKLSIDNKN